MVATIDIGGATLGIGPDSPLSPEKMVLACRRDQEITVRVDVEDYGSAEGRLEKLRRKVKKLKIVVLRRVEPEPVVTSSDQEAPSDDTGADQAPVAEYGKLEVALTWDNDHDLNLRVTDPCSHRVSYEKKVLFNDSFQGLENVWE